MIRLDIPDIVKGMVPDHISRIPGPENFDENSGSRTGFADALGG